MDHSSRRVNECICRYNRRPHMMHDQIRRPARYLLEGDVNVIPGIYVRTAVEQALESAVRDGAVERDAMGPSFGGVTKILLHLLQERTLGPSHRCQRRVTQCLPTYVLRRQAGRFGASPVIKPSANGERYPSNSHTLCGKADTLEQHSRSYM